MSLSWSARETRGMIWRDTWAVVFLAVMMCVYCTDEQPPTEHTGIIEGPPLNIADASSE